MNDAPSPTVTLARDVAEQAAAHLEFGDGRNIAAALRTSLSSPAGDAVERDPERRSGVALLKGTNFPVSQLLAEISDTAAVDEVADNFDLDRGIVRAALQELSMSPALVSLRPAGEEVRKVLEPFAKIAQWTPAAGDTYTYTLPAADFRAARDLLARLAPEPQAQPAGAPGGGEGGKRAEAEHLAKVLVPVEPTPEMRIRGGIAWSEALPTAETYVDTADACYKAMLAAAPSAAPEPAVEAGPTHKHVKSGGLYRVLHRGTLEADLTPVVIYESAKGRVWVRPAAEFDDGRFEPLPSPPPGDGKEVGRSDARLTREQHDVLMRHEQGGQMASYSREK